jgi:hypothetical protein
MSIIRPLEANDNPATDLNEQPLKWALAAYNAKYAKEPY